MTYNNINTLNELFILNYKNYYNNLKLLKTIKNSEDVKLINEANDILYDVLDTILEILIIGGAHDRE